MSVYAGTVVDVLTGAFGIITIVYGSIYKDDAYCASALVDPSLWLIIAGSVMLGVSVLDLLHGVYRIQRADLALVGMRLGLSRLISLILLLSAMFSTAWATVGGITLWEDCDSMTPHDLRIFMWIAVIVECLFALLNLIWLLSIIRI